VVHGIKIKTLSRPLPHH